MARIPPISNRPKDPLDILGQHELYQLKRYLPNPYVTAQKLVIPKFAAVTP
jgi:hypothetical protein